MRDESSAEVPAIQIQRELQIILKSELFAGSGKRKGFKKLSELLNHIVTRTLDGEVPREIDLLIDFYKKSALDLENDDPTARINVARLREKLGEYYATEGADDLVLIDIPKGQYGAISRYNSRASAQTEVRIGIYHNDRESAEDIKEALVHFEKAIQLQPNYAEAYAGKAAALIGLHNLEDDPKEFLQEAEIAARKAIALNERSWRAHAKLGGIHFFKHEWNNADLDFKRARELNASEVDDDGGYGPYLLCRGRYEDALHLANTYAKEHPTNVIFLQRRALYLYALRYFEEAKSTLEQLISRDKHFWLSHMQMSFVHLAMGDPERALEWFLSGERLGNTHPWPGLKVMCLASSEKNEEAEAAFSELLAAHDSGYIRPMQLALGYMALHSLEEATTFLERACEEFEPFTAWLHLWPFLDPLRRLPRFRALLKKWGFPPH